MCSSKNEGHQRWQEDTIFNKARSTEAAAGSMCGLTHRHGEGAEGALRGRSAAGF